MRLPGVRTPQRLIPTGAMSCARSNTLGAKELLGPGRGRRSTAHVWPLRHQFPVPLLKEKKIPGNAVVVIWLHLQPVHPPPAISPIPELSQVANEVSRGV